MGVWDMLPMDTLLLSLLSMLPPLWLLPITATPRFPPLLPSPPLVPPLLLSPPSEDSMPELDVMSPTLPVLSMSPRGRLRLRLIPMSSDTTDWDMVDMDWDMPDMEAMLDMEVMPV